MGPYTITQQPFNYNPFTVNGTFNASFLLQNNRLSCAMPRFAESGITTQSLFIPGNLFRGPPPKQWMNKYTEKATFLYDTANESLFGTGGSMLHSEVEFAYVTMGFGAALLCVFRLRHIRAKAQEMGSFISRRERQAPTYANDESWNSPSSSTDPGAEFI